MRTGIRKVVGVMGSFVLIVVAGHCRAAESSDTDKGDVLESVWVAHAPLHMNLHEETAIIPPVGDVISDSKATIALWTLGATLRLPADFRLSLSYSTGGGSDPSPDATVGGAPVAIGARDFDRQEYDLALCRRLYETQSGNGSQPMRVEGRLGYHQTVLEVPTSRETYSGGTVGLALSAPLAREWTAELNGDWMPSLRGGDNYDTVSGSATSWMLGIVYAPVQSSFSFRAGWQQARNSGDTSDLSSPPLVDVPGSTHFSFDEKTSGVSLTVIWRH